MSQGKPPLTMMPEVLPRPTQVVGVSSVRARAVARIKTLAAAGATSVIASCGYGVVDPLPQPTCFESPKPTVTAGYLVSAAEDAGLLTDGSTLVEVRVFFTQTGVTVGEIRAGVAGQSVPVTDKQVSETEARFVVRVPRGTTNATAYVEATCDRSSRPLQISLELGPTSVTANAY